MEVAHDLEEAILAGDRWRAVPLLTELRGLYIDAKSREAPQPSTGVREAPCPAGRL